MPHRGARIRVRAQRESLGAGVGRVLADRDLGRHCVGDNDLDVLTAVIGHPVGDTGRDEHRLASDRTAVTTQSDPVCKATVPLVMTEYSGPGWACQPLLDAGRSSRLWTIKVDGTPSVTIETGASVLPLARSVRTTSPSAGVAWAVAANRQAPQSTAVPAMRLRRIVTRSLCVNNGNSAA